MDFVHLNTTYEQLLSDMKEHDYCDSWIRRFKATINWLISHPKASEWKSYQDAYYEKEKEPTSKNNLQNFKTCIASIAQFDATGEFPNGYHHLSFIPTDSYSKLFPEFKSLIDFYRAQDTQSGKKKSTTVYIESQNAASFLYNMQIRGCNTLNKIKEKDVISFFISKNGNVSKSRTVRSSLKVFFEYCERFSNECGRLLLHLPVIKNHRKIIQYLTDKEIDDLNRTIEDPTNNLSLRDRAIACLLLYMGMRSCDIAKLVTSSINWDREMIAINQQKTQEPLELPLLPVVGNAIYDYISKERPASVHKEVFLTTKKPTRKLKSCSVKSICNKLLKTACIRQEKGARKGTHIFRHRLVASLLGNGVPKPVVTQILGHTASESLEAYTSADFFHLQECALSIEDFLLEEEVLSI
jgi:site-specific recombinase XerD